MIWIWQMNFDGDWTIFSANQKEPLIIYKYKLQV